VSIFTLAKKPLWAWAAIGLASGQKAMRFLQGRVLRVDQTEYGPFRKILRPHGYPIRNINISAFKIHPSHAGEFRLIIGVMSMNAINLRLKPNYVF